MKITELIGRLLAELVAHGDADVEIWDQDSGTSRDLDTVEAFTGYSETCRVVLDFDRRVL